MATDAPDPCITGVSATMVLNMQDNWVFVFHEEDFALPALSQFQEIIENANLFLCFLRKKIMVQTFATMLSMWLTRGIEHHSPHKIFISSSLLINVSLSQVTHCSQEFNNALSQLIVGCCCHMMFIFPNILYAVYGAEWFWPTHFSFDEFENICIVWAVRWKVFPYNDIMQCYAGTPLYSKSNTWLRGNSKFTVAQKQEKK